jgi:hypothetical protein
MKFYDPGTISRRRAIGALLTPVLASCLPDKLLAPDDARPRFDLSTETVTLIGAGDSHAKVNITQARLTGRLIQAMLDRTPGARAFCLGDCTENGTAEEFALYDTAWGSFRDRTDFQIGNHDLLTDPTAKAYYDYAGAAAGPRGKGYYAKTYGRWRVYFLNSQTGRAAQTTWLANDLPQWSADHHIMAMWHQPMHASVCVHNGKAMTYPAALGPWWQLLVDHGAELVLSGHVHRYERLARLLRDGTASPLGVRQFVIGTGGAGPMEILTVHPHNEARAVTRGVFRLDLKPTDTAGVVRDQGTTPCRAVLA